MNLRILACLLVVTLGGLGAPAAAQEQGPSAQTFAPAASPQTARELRNAKRQLARLTKKLKLSAQQQDEIKPILEDKETQMRNLRQDRSLSREDRSEKANGIVEDGDSKIEAFLNDSQKQIFEKQQQAMERQMQRRATDDSSMDDFPPPPPDDDGGGPLDGGPPPDGGPPGW
jgi:periplasmic protein CpxP/Spy